MGQYLLCGKIAEHPYYIRELGLRIYTAEEFCYYIFNNTYLLEEDFIRPQLVDFFRREVAMPELADKIIKYYGSSADMANVLVIIMRDVSYYNENQIAQFQDRLNRMRRQNHLDRSRERADLLLEKGRYECAVQIYSGILQHPRDIRLKPQFYAQVLQHMGVAYMRMGYVEEALECLQAAYAEGKDEKILEQMYYLALRSGLPFCRELQSVSSAQLSRWNVRYQEVESANMQAVRENALLPGISGDPEENRRAADRYLAGQKKAYCHMVMSE